MNPTSPPYDEFQLAKMDIQPEVRVDPGLNLPSTGPFRAVWVGTSSVAHAKLSSYLRIHNGFHVSLLEAAKRILQTTNRATFSLA